MRSGWTLSVFWALDAVGDWVEVIMILARGCRGQRMRSGCTKSWLWPMDALRDG